MRGRKPKPSKLKILHGNPGRRPLPKNEPKPEPGKPDPPAWFEPGSEAMQAWDDLSADLDLIGVLTKADRAALVALVEAYLDWREACREVAKEGLSYASVSNKGGYSIRPQPAVAIRSDSWKRYKSMLSEFGMTPSSRTRVRTNPEKSKGAFARYLEGA